MRCEWKVSFQSWLIKQPVVVSLCVAVGVKQRWQEMGKQTAWLLPGFQGSLLSADVQGGQEPPTKMDQLT